MTPLTPTQMTASSRKSASKMQRLTSDSDAILLDGVFNGISFVVVLLSSRLAGVIETAGSPDFPFGYAHFEPLLNSFRGLLILAVSGFALFGAAVFAMTRVRS